MAHENLHRPQQIEGSSDRAFGFVFAGVFLIIACWPLLFGTSPRWWAMAIAAGFAGVSVWKPVILAGANRLWIKLGILLGAVISPVALGVVFYGVMLPIGVVMRLAGKDPLRLQLDPKARSYWIERNPPGPQPGSMTKQF